MQSQDVDGQQSLVLLNYFRMEQILFHGTENVLSQRALPLEHALLVILLHGRQTVFPGMRIQQLKQ
jgi:hypothetical protein